MTINEDTGEDIVCNICGNPEYWVCGHLVADFDRTFCECLGGELFDKTNDFENIIEELFLAHLKRSSVPNLEYDSIKELWQEAQVNYSRGDDFVDLDGCIFQRFLIELLEEAGAFDLPEPLMDPGGPGMTSSVSLLFAEDPSYVIEKAFRQLSAVARGDTPDTSPYVKHVGLWDRDPFVDTSDGRTFIEGPNGWFETKITKITSSMNPAWFYNEEDPNGWKKWVGGDNNVAEVERMLGHCTEENWITELITGLSKLVLSDDLLNARQNIVACLSERLSPDRSSILKLAQLIEIGVQRRLGVQGMMINSLSRSYPSEYEVLVNYFNRYEVKMNS